MKSPMVNVTLSPIAPWPLIVLAAAAVVALTLWTYRSRLRGSSGRGRWVAFTLRMLALILCLLAAVRPSVVLLEKVKQTATIAFLIDGSASMGVNDEVGNRARIVAARAAMNDGMAVAKKIDQRLEVAAYQFDHALKPYKADEKAPPEGKQSALGAALVGVLKELQGKKLVAVVLHSDGASNAGLAPLTAAQRLRAMQVPVVAVGYGSETAGEASRDLAVREVDHAPTVFVKNQLQVRGTLRARGFPGQKLEVELFTEGEPKPVATAEAKAIPGQEVVAFKDLAWVPKKVGETRLTVRVKPKEGELVKTNNDLSTYVNVRAGGIRVLYLQGLSGVWEAKYVYLALEPAQEIAVDLIKLREPAQPGGQGVVTDEMLASGYDVFILSDLPPDFLTPRQHAILVKAVENGAGLAMLGGRSSFGAGGWAGTPVAKILPVAIAPTDGQIEPESGLKITPARLGLQEYIMRLSATPAESTRVWDELPPSTGANVLGPPKPSATVLAVGPNDEPIMVIHPYPRGRVAAFAAETWPWYRANEQSNAAHRRFWRQVILWLAQKEDQGGNQVRLTLDRRRAAMGQKVEATVVTRDAKNEPVPDVSYETSVEYLAPGAGKPETLDLFTQGNEARGTYFATGAPGEYKVTVKATKGGQAIGSDSARFQVFADDRELENPAADLGLLKAIAEQTAGKYLQPEQLGPYLRSLDPSVITDATTQKEHRVWDNWPFFLIFVALLSVEWWLRKKIGWV